MMISGINTDIKYKGEIFHIQTEDGGENSPVITTLLFKAGAIYASKRTDYGKVLQPDSPKDAVQELMREQHKGMIRDLTSGLIVRAEGINRRKKDVQSPPEKPAPKTEEIKVKVKAKKEDSLPKPVGKETTGKKSLDDLILDYISSKDENDN
ncbi:MAG: hypothetical protein ABGX83_10820 [Nitrospira sp.]|nr:hypothetical protein [Candidatus Manganitrophaceae bacterium]HIL34557.1 hypothetical protein [Candidatus Manganitrophaceae bacterium]